MCILRICTVFALHALTEVHGAVLVLVVGHVAISPLSLSYIRYFEPSDVVDVHVPINVKRRVVLAALVTYMLTCVRITTVSPISIAFGRPGDFMGARKFRLFMLRHEQENFMSALKQTRTLFMLRHVC